jgi:rod shape-determining protein MreB
MLRHFIRKAANKTRSRADVMVCVPSGITQVERNAVTRAALAAGARHAFLIEEPMAAAIGAGLPVAEPVGALVVDIGGGTTETAVTALGALAVVNSIKVGGYQMDDAIVRSIQQRERLLVGQEQAEALKVGIGSATPDVLVEEHADVAGRDLTTGLLRRTSISAAQIRDALQRPLEQIVAAVKDLLDLTPAELSADVIEHGVTSSAAAPPCADSIRSSKPKPVCQSQSQTPHHRRTRRWPSTRGTLAPSNPQDGNADRANGRPWP